MIKLSAVAPILKPTDEQLIDDIRQYVSKATLIPLDSILIANNNLARPLNSFVTVNILTDKSIGKAKNSNKKTTQLREIDVSIQIYREYSRHFINLLYLYSETRQQDFNSNKYISFKNRSEIRDLTSIVSNEIEERFSINLTFTYYKTIEYFEEIIKKVDFNNEPMI